MGQREAELLVAPRSPRFERHLAALDVGWPSRQNPRMCRVSDSTPPIGGLQWTPLMVLPSPCQNKVGTPKK
jgi:hypothetical protein